MNKPIATPMPDQHIGPLDEHGQQIWSLAEEAAIARIDADPVTWAAMAEAEADIAAGRVHTSEEVQASMSEMKRKWFAERDVTPPPGYFNR